MDILKNKVSNLINKTRVHMFKKFKDKNLDLSFTYGLPHITIIYGPVIKAIIKLSLNKKQLIICIQDFSKNSKNYQI